MAVARDVKGRFVSTTTKTWLDVKGVRAAVKQASPSRLFAAGAHVQQVARSSMKGGYSSGEDDELIYKPSEPGQPPHAQHGGAGLKGSIQVALTPKPSSLVGPTVIYGRAQEFGCVIQVTPRMRRYLHVIGIHLRADTTEIHLPPRPFMAPALAASLPFLKGYLAHMPLASTPAGRALNASRRPAP